MKRQRESLLNSHAAQEPTTKNGKKEKRMSKALLALRKKVMARANISPRKRKSPPTMHYRTPISARTIRKVQVPVVTTSSSTPSPQPKDDSDDDVRSSPEPTPTRRRIETDDTDGTATPVVKPKPVKRRKRKHEQEPGKTGVPKVYVKRSRETPEKFLDDLNFDLLTAKDLPQPGTGRGTTYKVPMAGYVGRPNNEGKLFPHQRIAGKAVNMETFVGTGRKFKFSKAYMSKFGLRAIGKPGLRTYALNIEEYTAAQLMYQLVAQLVRLVKGWRNFSESLETLAGAAEAIQTLCDNGKRKMWNVRQSNALLTL